MKHVLEVVNKYAMENISGITTRFYCGRGSPLGNPYPITKEEPRDTVCDKYEEHFAASIRDNWPEVTDPNAMERMLQKILGALERRNVQLVCFCKPRRCHCDTVANEIERKRK